MTKLALTKLGEFVHRWSATTSTAWWRTLWTDANRYADDHEAKPGSLPIGEMLNRYFDHVGARGDC